MAVAIEKDLIQKIDPSRLANWSKLDPAFQGEYGPTVTVEVNGIAYNPDLVPRPKGYRDLFENPAYAGKVSWTGFGSNTAVMAYTQLAKIFGSGPADMDAVFKLFKDHPENLAKVVDSTNHQMTLYQQGEIAVFMASTGNVAKLKSLGLKAEFVHPETGSPAAPVNIHLTKGAANVDAAYAYMDAAISKAAQDKLKLPPTEMFPTNKEVDLTPGIEAYVTRAGPCVPRLSGLDADQQEPTGLDPSLQRLGCEVIDHAGERLPIPVPDAPDVGAVLRVAARPSPCLQFRGCDGGVTGELRQVPRRSVQLPGLAEHRHGWGLRRCLRTTLLGIPIALLYWHSGPRMTTGAHFLTLIPMLTSNVVRTFAWIVILGGQGPISEALVALGLTASPISLMFTELGLVLAMTQIDLPLIILPLIAILSRLPRHLTRCRRGRRRRSVADSGDRAPAADAAGPARRLDPRLREHQRLLRDPGRHRRRTQRLCAATHLP